MKLRNLRETIPHVMNFDLVEPSAPEQLHLHFAQVARGAAMDIKKFAHIMEDSNSKEVLEKARESYSRSGDDMRNWLVTEHADWLDVKGDNEDDGVKLEEKEVEVKKSVLQEDAEDVKSILEAFKEAHPNLDISMDEASGETKVCAATVQTFPTIITSPAASSPTSTNPLHHPLPTLRPKPNQTRSLHQRKDQIPQIHPRCNSRPPQTRTQTRKPPRTFPPPTSRHHDKPRC